MTLACRACGTSTPPFMSFGHQPLANGFRAPEDTGNEYFYELQVGVCPCCHLFQLIDQPAPGEMFHGNYAYVSQSSKGMQVHFEKFAEEVRHRWLNGTNMFIVEIGCNDGTMLRHFANAGYKHLGVEASKNVAELAESSGVKTMNRFFNPETSDKILAEHGHADVILAANVISHIPDLAGVAKGVANLLKPDGVFIFEEPYLGDVIENCAYDQIYSEHVFLHSAHSVRDIFAPFGLELIYMKRHPTHGGSMRYTLARSGRRKIMHKVETELAREKEQRLWHPETLTRFKNRCEASRDKFKRLIGELKEAGNSIVGYGAPAKSTTILNYCGLGPEHFDYLSDTIPFKHGKLSPGAHILVRPHQEFLANYPDYAVLFAWNHREEILAKEKQFTSHGGKWVTVIPEVGIE